MKLPFLSLAILFPLATGHKHTFFDNPPAFEQDYWNLLETQRDGTVLGSQGEKRKAGYTYGDIFRVKSESNILSQGSSINTVETVQTETKTLVRDTKGGGQRLEFSTEPAIIEIYTSY